LRIRLELLRFWDAEALSRRANQQIETKQHSTDEAAQQNSKDYSRISEESAKLTIAAESENVKKYQKIIIKNSGGRASDCQSSKRTARIKTE
jgi:hypothetical protein